VTALARFRDDRLSRSRDMLLEELDRMHASGGPAVDFDEAWTHYRQQLMTSLTWWTVTLSASPDMSDMPDVQPRDITEEFIRRIATTSVCLVARSSPQTVNPTSRRSMDGNDILRSCEWHSPRIRNPTTPGASCVLGIGRTVGNTIGDWPTTSHEVPDSV
jgi:hypothetical protein